MHNFKCYILRDDYVDGVWFRVNRYVRDDSGSMVLEGNVLDGVNEYFGVYVSRDDSVYYIIGGAVYKSSLSKSIDGYIIGAINDGVVECELPANVAEILDYVFGEL